MICRHLPHDGTYSIGSPFWHGRQVLHWNVPNTARARRLVTNEAELGDRVAVVLGADRGR